MGDWREHVSNDTRKMIDRIVSRNNELRKYKEKYNMYFIVFFGAVIVIILYGFLYFMNSIATDDPLNSLKVFLSNMIHLVMFLIVGLLFFIIKNVNSKIVKLKSNIEKLRLELIDHLKNAWYINDYSDLRDQLSTYLENEGIDVRYKG